ncbi:aldo/keto reductase [Acuticoccus sp. I52.16.1]|uniref:aldo/keto reductase n=1 Tax=Acuticoccus sp. I52.16.1 TaxID=2928472 RepID=UPI001FD3EA04|nr:aldo/keto reductase [Acuticoccus sp. I52.16.1]UOM35678.1 aldo/keto reductase [Acuticoccus sp. I52.16.1]
MTVSALVPLGRSGLRVSRLCLGTMMFGGRTDETDSARITDRAIDAGINFIDTADAYNGGRSEEILGRILKGKRDRLVVASKLGNPIGDDPNHRGLSPAWILAEVPKILDRLATDRLDVLYLHKEDPHTPLEETVRALEVLVRQGRVLHIGVSNHKAWRVAQLTRYCEEAGIGRPVVCQPLYHALNRSIEVELLPACADMQIAVYPYSPIARGVLTGKYAPGAEAPEGSRASARDKRIMETEFHPETLAAAAKLAEHAKARGTDLGGLALAFVLANPMISGAVVGPRTLAQMESYIAGLDVTWGAEDEAAFEAVVPKGSTAVRHFVDPQYPVEGRPAEVAR